jgi:hypothetical protein
MIAARPPEDSSVQVLQSEVAGDSHPGDIGITNQIPNWRR